MKPFARTGFWWRPETPDKKAYGTLSCSASGDLRLDLFGALAANNDHRERLPVVLGQAPDDTGTLSSSDLTLSQCMRVGQTSRWDAPVSRQSFIPSRCLIGGHFPSVESSLFTAADVRFDALDAWSEGLTGFRDSQSFQIEWAHPEPLSGGFPGGQFTVGVGGRANDRLRTRSIEEHVGLIFKYHQPQTTQAIEADLVYPIQNFLTFACDKACSLTEFTVRQDFDSERGVEIVGPRIQPTEETEERHPFRLLFTLADIRHRLEDVICRWLELAQTKRSALAIYFSSLYAPPRYTDIRFEQLAQAVALYYSAGSAAEDGRTDADHAVVSLRGTIEPATLDLLASMCDSHPLVLTERAVSTLAKRHRAVFSPLVGDVDNFTRETVGTLRYLITRREPVSPLGVSLYWLGEKMAFLFKINLLHDLGFTNDEVEGILGRNETYDFMRGQRYLIPPPAGPAPAGPPRP